MKMHSSARSILTRLAGFTGATLAGAALSVLVFVPAAHAYSYDGYAAAAYAHKWSANASVLRNSSYRKFDNDCTNFAPKRCVPAG